MIFKKSDSIQYPSLTEKGKAIAAVLQRNGVIEGSYRQEGEYTIPSPLATPSMRTIDGQISQPPQEWYVNENDYKLIKELEDLHFQ